MIEAPRYDEKKIPRLRDLAHDGKPLTQAAHAACPGRVAWIERAWGETPVTAVHGCRDPKTHGHTPQQASGSLAGPLSEEEKAQRARVRENDTAWRSAATVRREWLRGLLRRKTAPKGGAVFLADALARGDHELRRAFERGHRLGHDLLGVQPGEATWAAPPNGSAPSSPRPGRPGR